MTVRRKISNILILIMITGTAVLLLSLTGIGCPFRYLTGISCPGCGMTRAWISVLHLHIAQALYYHPLFIMPVIAAVVYLKREKPGYRNYQIIYIVCIILLLAVYAYRMLSKTAMDVVVFAPEEGLLYQIINIMGGNRVLS